MVESVGQQRARLASESHSRRAFVKTALVAGGALAIPGCVSAPGGPPQTAAVAPTPIQPPPAPTVAKRSYPTPPGVRHELFQKAVASLDRHDRRFRYHDRLAIADFTPFSAKPRFQLIDLHAGTVRNMLVTHGSGSDRAHTGFLRNFSNVPDSEATSEGAYVTANYYYGQHDHSQRLIGLDHTNNNALDRAIVIHAAWYANADMIQKHGMIGRSQGCFAVGETELAGLFAWLGEGRLLYAGRV